MVRKLCLGYVSTLLYLQVLSSTPEPEFAGDIPSLTIIAGRDAVLKCAVDNIGDYKVAWVFIDKQKILSMHTHVITRNERVGVSHHKNRTWHLEIRNVEPEDSGYYMCQISTQPMKSQVGHLDVVVPPEFVHNMTYRNLAVMENANVTLSCKATGNPVPNIKWQREDGQIFFVGNDPVREYKNDELRLTGVTRLHMAAYLCLASNGVPPPISRRIYLDVTFPPLIWIQNQLVGAPEGTDVSLECHTEAHPTSQNFWLRRNEPVDGMDSRYQTEISRNSYKAHMKLVIKQLQSQDYGSYKCVAKNSIGETEGSITLYRLKIPTPETRTPQSEELPTRTPKKTTVLLTKEDKIVPTEMERIEKSNPSGRQQKYGDGTKNVKNKGIHPCPPSVLIFLSLELLRLTSNMDWR